MTSRMAKLGPKTQELEDALRQRVLDATCAFNLKKGKEEQNASMFQRALITFCKTESMCTPKRYSAEEWAELVFAANKECNGVLPLSIAKLYEEYHRIDTVYKMSFDNKTFDECMEETKITQTPAHFQKFLQSTHPDTRRVMERHHDASWKAADGQRLWNLYPTERTNGFLHHETETEHHESQKIPTQDDFPALPTKRVIKKQAPIKPAMPKPVEQPKTSWGNIPVKRISNSRRKKKK